ncbi:probable cinnamyl alcohol dehydrogenase 9 [Solanum tuberosum]|nr:PREDICTED: probable cinnamyl alcohol dehydrogenase 9 [Solanum tuberosum]
MPRSKTEMLRPYTMLKQQEYSTHSGSGNGEIDGWDRLIVPAVRRGLISRLTIILVEEEYASSALEPLEFLLFRAFSRCCVLFRLFTVKVAFWVSLLKKKRVGSEWGLTFCLFVLFIYEQAAMNTLDGIIDTVSAVHPNLPLLMLMKSHGKLVMVGAPEKPVELPVFTLLMGRKVVAGSCIGGMKETQEMLDFAAKHNITPDIEVVSMDYVNTALERLLKSDVNYGFVLDIGNTLNKK